MKNIKKAHLRLTETQLITIQNKIQNWKNKEVVIDIMRHKYGENKDKAA